MSIEMLLVEDSLPLAETVVSYCELEGIVCDFASTGSQGLKLALKNDYAAILLDVNLPHMNGLEVCEAIRQQGVDTPVLWKVSMQIKALKHQCSMLYMTVFARSFFQVSQPYWV